MTAINPTFIHLMTRYAELHEAGLDDTPEASDLFSQAYNLAPNEFKEALHDAAVEQGLISGTPDGYSDDGEPLYIFEKQCERLGIDPDDLPEHLTRRAYRGNFNRTN